MKNTLHKEIMREAAVCSRMKPKPMDGKAEKKRKAPRAMSERAIKNMAAKFAKARQGGAT